MKKTSLLTFKGPVIWMTGRSGSGKTTIAKEVVRVLHSRTRGAYVNLDGDVVRGGLCRDLGFSIGDRTENLRRIAEVARLFSNAGVGVIVSTISPLIELRMTTRNFFHLNGSAFTLVHVDCPLPKCEVRDPKGLYEKARCGQIELMTSVQSPYEEPSAIAEDFVHVRTDESSVQQCVEHIFANIKF